MGDFDLDRPYRLDPRVVLRSERFGALAYHYGNRRLTFLRSPRLLEVVEDLHEHASVRQALAAAKIAEDEAPRYARALRHLEQCEVIHAR